MGKQFLGVFFLAFVFLFAQTNVVKGSNVIFCYWGTWSHYRTGNGQFQVSNIDPNLCTHIGYSFFGLGDNDEIKSLDTWLDFDLGNIEKTIALKKVNPSLKVMASVGGWNEGSTKYSAMASSMSRRARFISSVVTFLRQHGFDGLDLDWEYPAQRGGSSADRANFVTLLRELKIALKAHNLLLTVAVAAGQSSAFTSYDIPNFSKHVDLINVMTYDFSGAYDGHTGFNSPLQSSENNNVKSAISYWLENGAPASKLVLGLPLYGRSYTLANSAQNGLGVSSSGPGNSGPYTQERGYLGYSEICEKLKAGWTRRWDSKHLVPYIFSGNQWVGYDDKESFVHKINFLKSLNLAGAMVWSIETDDFRGACGESFPLLKTIKNNLDNATPGVTPSSPNSTAAPNSSPAPTSTPAPTSEQTSAPNTGSCQQDGKFVNRSACNRYYQCYGGIRYDFVCPAGLNFDQENGICNWPESVNCNP